MTQQFKFGDRVSCSYLEENETAIVISHQPQSGSCYVITPDKESFWVDDKALTLIPHPDTVRLDYIQNRLPEIRLVECNEAGAVAFCLTRKSGFVCTNTLSPSIRETIDHAMQQEQTP